MKMFVYVILGRTLNHKSGKRYLEDAKICRLLLV